MRPVAWTIALCCIGVLLLYLGEAPWGWLDYRPVLARRLAPAFGEALVIAGVLALVVDPWLKHKLYKEAVRNVFEHLIGFDHEPELKARIRSIAFDTKIYIRDYDLTCEIAERQDGDGVVIKAIKTVHVVNQGLEDQSFQPGWVFAWPDRASRCKVIHFIDDVQSKIEDLGFAEKDHGYLDTLSQPVTIKPRRTGKRYCFRAECTFEAPHDSYHPMYFSHPTIGVSIQVKGPEGWTVWVGRESSPLSNEAAFHNKGINMTAQKIEIQWRKP
jgi:hypothetical protein